MKRFVFRLESVLKLRRFELDRARAELAVLEQEWARRIALVNAAQADLERGREILAAEVAEGADGERLAMRADGVTVGRIKLQRAELDRNELDPAIAEARQRVFDARVRVKSLERLRGHRSEAHRRESQAAEQRALEELAIERVARRQMQMDARRRAEQAEERKTP